MDYVKMGNAIRQKRIRLNMTQEALSEIVGVSAGYYSHIENGDKQPSFKVLGKICSCLELELSELFSETSVTDAEIYENKNLEEAIYKLKHLDEKELNFVINMIDSLKKLKE